MNQAGSDPAAFFEIPPDDCRQGDHADVDDGPAVWLIDERDGHGRNGEDGGDESQRVENERNHGKDFHDLVLFGIEKGIVGLAQVGQ